MQVAGQVLHADQTKTALGSYEDCKQVWPTTTSTPTVPPGCCFSDSYKSNDKCRKMDDDRARCEK